METTQSRARIERQKLQILTLFDQKMQSSKNKTRAIKQVSEILGISIRQVFRVLKQTNHASNQRD